MDEPASKHSPARVQAVNWLLQLEASPNDDALRQAFELWLGRSEEHRAAFRSAQYTWGRLDKLPQLTSTGSSATGNVVPLRLPRRGRTIWAAATALVAACLLLMFLPVIQKHLEADHVTGVAELRDVTLPDGSVAVMDAGSAIAVNYSGTERGIVLVAGQAFFKVVHDAGRPFIVRASDMSVRVTGTAFSVDKMTDSIAVSVESGTIEVSSPGAETASRLGMGERLVFDRHTSSVRRQQVSPSMVASWRSRRLVVHDVTLGDMVDVLGRYLPGVIIVRDKSWNRQSISGVFDLTQPQEALNALADSQHGKLSQITPYLSVISPR